VTSNPCDPCHTSAVVIWAEQPVCSECFLAASIQHATGRDDLYLTLRTLHPQAAEYVIRAILRQIASQNQMDRD
jgi:hypothetical protein